MHATKEGNSGFAPPAAYSFRFDIREAVGSIWRHLQKVWSPTPACPGRAGVRGRCRRSAAYLRATMDSTCAVDQMGAICSIRVSCAAGALLGLMQVRESCRNRSCKAGR
eukprot:scaffold3687_cov240-Pinguiococcus_pyrenoidosus.AAC.10